MKAPQSPNTLIIQPEGGLANRIHLIISFAVYARALNKKLQVIWSKDNNTHLHVADGHFLEGFKQLPSCEFISAAPDYPITFKGCLTKNKDAYPSDFKKINKEHGTDFLKFYRFLIPTAQVKKNLDNLVRERGPFNAIHLRKTDFCNFLKKTGEIEIPEREFESFIERRPDLPCYIATDNRETQHKFEAQYPETVFFYRKINNAPTGLRHTTLFHAIVDLFMCCDAVEFKKSHPHSTFSTLIERIRSVACKKK